MRKIKSWLGLSNVLNVLLLALAFTVLFNTSARAFMIRGLMHVGLFQPHFTDVKQTGNQKLNDFIVQNNAGVEVRLSHLKGKVVFINFWATWCGPCVAEMPSINALYQRLKQNKNVVFMSVDVDGNLKNSDKFMRSHKYSLPLYKAVSQIPQNFVDQAIPATVIIDKSGRLVARQQGATDYSNPKVYDYLKKLAE